MREPLEQGEKMQMFIVPTQEKKIVKLGKQQARKIAQEAIDKAYLKAIKQ